MISKKKLKWRVKITIIVISLVIFFFLSLSIISILLVSNSKIRDEFGLEDELRELSEKYYLEKINDRFLNTDKFIIKLNVLDNVNYNIDNFKDCDKETTYAEIIIENPKETDRDLIKYSIDIYLNCN